MSLVELPFFRTAGAWLLCAAGCATGVSDVGEQGAGGEDGIVTGAGGAQGPASSAASSGSGNGVGGAGFGGGAAEGHAQEEQRGAHTPHDPCPFLPRRPPPRLSTSSACGGRAGPAPGAKANTYVF